jgi:RmlD substrate binding domain
LLRESAVSSDTLSSNRCRALCSDRRGSRDDRLEATRWNRFSSSVSSLTRSSTVGLCLLHFSAIMSPTGAGKFPCLEEDAARPLSAYGLSKLAGENQVRAAGCNLIIRTSWLYAAQGSNFVTTIARAAANRRADFRRYACRCRVPYRRLGNPDPSRALKKGGRIAPRRAKPRVFCGSRSQAIP